MSYQSHFIIPHGFIPDMSWFSPTEHFVKKLGLLVYFIGLVLLINVTAPSAVAEEPVCGGVTDGLVACYPFNGNVNDESGNGRNGITYGNIQYAVGVFDQAAKFSAYRDLIQLPNASLNGTLANSVSIWVKMDSSRAMGVLSGARSGSDNEYLIYIDTGIIHMYRRGYVYMGKLRVDDGKFHHLVITTEINGKVNIYIDGTLDITANSNATPLSISSHIWLGQDQDSVNGGFNSSQQLLGLIDDLRVYNRALTASEVKQLTSPVQLISAIPSTPVCKSANFGVTVRAKTVLSVDGAQLDLKFDPSQLRVNSITNSNILDAELTNSFDNTNGTIQFAASAWDNAAPTADFDIFTINFTAIGTAGNSTVLDFLNSSTLTADGKSVAYLLKDEVLSFSQCSNYRVNLQRAVAKPADSWRTELKVSLGNANSAVEYQTTCDTSGLGQLVLGRAIGTSDYFCVKNSHTLANKVSQPFGNPVNFGTLLEGDTNNDNSINILDQTLMRQYRGCRGINSTYNSQGDFNVSGCIDTADLNLLKANFNKPSACKLNTTLKMYRKGQRDGDRQAVGLGVTALPTDLKVGSTFDYTIRVNATEAQAADGAGVYLNFDPTKLKVNSLVKGQSFDVELENSFDNDKGEINFAAGVWDNPAPTQKVDLVTVNLTVLEIGGEKTLSFSNSEERQTMVAAGGEEVTEVNEDGSIKVEPTTPDEPPVVVEPPVVEGKYTAHGTLKDKAGNILSGVTVQIGDKTVVTDGAGNWEIGGLVEGTYDVVALKEGFACLTSDVELGNQQYLQAVNCEPVTSLKAKLTNKQWGAIPQGENLSYTVTLFNGGTVAATNIALTGKFPEGVTVAKFEGDTAVCESGTCTLAELAPGASATLTLELSNLPATGKNFMNSVTVTSTEYPADEVKSWRKVKPYLSLLGKSIPNPVEMGKALHYQLAAELLNTAPETTAKDVKAEIRLPNEVKFVQATASQGTCENVGNTVTCNLGDLSVETSDSISRVDIQIDAELGQDLVQLNAETKVTASNYPEHTEVIATNTVLGDGKVDGILLLDVTASMGDELQAVIKAVKDKLNQQFENAAKPVIALVSFRDSVKIEVISDDLNTLLEALKKLEAKDGGLCPEASAQALDLALDHIKPNGLILFVTDAPPYDNTDIEALKAKIVAKQANFVPIVTTSDCATNQLSSPQQ